MVLAADAPQIPAPQGFVNDFAGVLSSEEKISLQDISQDLQAATGAELVYVIAPSIDPYDDFTYGMAVFNQWKIGAKGKDTGLLVLLAIKERRLRIITGYGLEAVLPDGKVGRFRDEYLTPYLKQGKLGEGLANIGLRFAQEIAQAEGKTLEGAAARAPHKNREQSSKSLLKLVLFLVVLIIIVISNISNSRRGLRSGGMFLGGGGFSSGGGGFGGGFGGFGGGFSGGGGSGGSW